jgi:hypothetical protein
MPWKSKEPDPIADRRRQLEEQERLLAEQRRKLTRTLKGEAPQSAAKAIEPPVWRMDENSTSRPIESSARRRQLARQRRRDMLLFFVFIGVLLVVVAIVLWVAYVHNSAPTGGV